MGLMAASRMSTAPEIPFASNISRLNRRVRGLALPSAGRVEAVDASGRTVRQEPSPWAGRGEKSEEAEARYRILATCAGTASGDTHDEVVASEATSSAPVVVRISTVTAVDQEAARGEESKAGAVGWGVFYSCSASKQIIIYITTGTTYT